VQVGAGNTQINYVYNGLTWADGMAPPPLVSVSGVIESPYRGLAAFDEQDAGFFFGREAASQQVLERMSRLAGGGAGLLVVSGVSGAGKSSLVRAGVIPRIRGTGLASAPGAADWPALVLTPTRTPLDELALRVAMLGHADASSARRWAASDPAAFALTVRQAALTAAASRPAVPAQPAAPARAPGPPGQPAPRLLLVVDQFEQVFTQCPDEGERTAFIAALHAAATVAQGAGQVPAALVVLCVRADFEARCADYPQLADAIQDRYLVTAMTGRQLRLAITAPARQAGAEVDDDLAEVLLAEVRGREPGASGAGVLPLLSHALDQAWRSRAGAGLTLADYERTGGIERAVAGSAQRAYDGLAPARQAVARQVFIALTAVGGDNADTAQRVTRGGLMDGRDPGGKADVEAVLEAFAAERLLTLAADSVEISHEVLLRAWPLLRDTWLAQTHADRVVRTRLRDVAGEWARTSRDSSYLYKGTLLAAAAEAAARLGADPARVPPLSQGEREFLAASDHAVRVQARRRRALLGVLATLTVVAVILGGVAGASAVNATRQAGIATQQAALATRQHALALSRQLAAEALSASPTSPVTARRLAAAAWHVSPTSQAADAMTALLAEQQQRGFLPAAPSPARDSVIPTFDQEFVVAFSPDGTLLAGGDDDGAVRVWNAATGQPVGVPVQTNLAQANHVAVLGLAFSPDGTLLASGGGDGKLRVWNPATGHVVAGPVRPDAHRSYVAVAGVAFSPDGTLLAAACNDGSVRLWSTAKGGLTGPPLRTLAYHPGNSASVIAFSPDGRLLAAGGSDGNLRVWNPGTGRPVTGLLQAEPLGGSLKSVNTVAFSPDGRLLASLGSEGTVRIWDAATGSRAGGFQTPGPSGGPGAMAFTPDGALLATADGDHRVRTWDPLTGRLIGEPLRIDATVDTFVNGIAVRPHGHLLAGAAGDGTVRLWDMTTRRPVGGPLRAVAGNNAPVITDVAFGPRGGLLAAIGTDGLVRLWNPATGRPAGPSLRAGGTGMVGTVAFSPDGKQLAVGGGDIVGGDGKVRVWDLAAGRPLGPRRLAGLAGKVDLVTAVVFGPHGVMAAAGAVPQVSVWDQDGRRRVIETGGHAWDVAFTPDGTWLAVADEDGTLRLWNPDTGRPAGPSFRVAPKDSTVTALRFSPDGMRLATADGSGTVALWDPAAGRRVRGPLLTGAVRPIGMDGLAFSPDGRLLAGVGSDGLARLWDPATGRPVSGLLQAVDTGNIARAVAFSPDGKQLATAGTDGAIRLWDVWLLTHPYQALCAAVGAPTNQEWTRYAPGEPPRVACSR
jgi:WD40 repeat protein